MSSQLESELKLVQGSLTASVLLFVNFFLLCWLSLHDGGSSWASHLPALPVKRKRVSFRASSWGQIGYKPTHGLSKVGQTGSCFG